MPNPFFESFQQPPQSQLNPQDLTKNFNECKSNPTKFLADRGINVPEEYAGNPEQMAKYLLGNMPQVQQNKVFQTANMLKGIFGMK